MTITAEHMAVELASQPETWARAIALTADQALLPASGRKVAIVRSEERRVGKECPV